MNALGIADFGHMQLPVTVDAGAVLIHGIVGFGRCYLEAAIGKIYIFKLAIFSADKRDILVRPCVNMVKIYVANAGAACVLIVRNAYEYRAAVIAVHYDVVEGEIFNQRILAPLVGYTFIASARQRD